MKQGRITEGIVLTLNKTETRWGQSLGRGATSVCFVKRPIRFDRPGGGRQIWNGYWGSMVSYFGPNREKFAKVFGAHGFIR